MEKIWSEIQEAIDIAWASDDEVAKEKQQILFPEGKPDPAAFILRIAFELL